MYENLPLEVLVPNSQNANRISRMFAKKLRHNIKQTGMYETLTVRPHPRMKGRFEVLNGHARLQVLRELDIPDAKCDIWDVTGPQAHLFLAILNKLRGSDVPELRMNLLFELLHEHPKEELAAHIPETVSYLARLERLPEEAEKEEVEAPPEKPEVIIVNFYLSAEQHHLVSKALDNILQKFALSDSGEALAKMAQLYLGQSKAANGKHRSRQKRHVRDAEVAGSKSQTARRSTFRREHRRGPGRACSTHRMATKSPL